MNRRRLKDPVAISAHGHIEWYRQMISLSFSRFALPKNVNNLDDLRERIYAIESAKGFVVRLSILLVVPQLELVTAKLKLQTPKPPSVTDKPAMVRLLPGTQAGALKKSWL